MSLGENVLLEQIHPGIYEADKKAWQGVQPERASNQMPLVYVLLMLNQV